MQKTHGINPWVYCKKRDKIHQFGGSKSIAKWKQKYLILGHNAGADTPQRHCKYATGSAYFA